MNVLRNFEAVFAVALGVAAAVGYVAQPAGAADGAPTLRANVATPSTMAVVTVSAKRMSTLEKQRSLEDERGVAKAGGASAHRS